MNKYKKIATAVVATVMAGTMVFSLAACNSCKKDTVKPPKGTIADPVRPETAPTSAGYPSEDADYKLTYAENTELSLNIGNGNGGKAQSISYKSGEAELTGTATMPDGKTYNTDDLKPAWQSLQSTLKLKLSDGYDRTSYEGDGRITSNTAKLGDWALMTAGLSSFVANADYFVNLTEYLYWMPNYTKFLQENPVTAWSLTGEGTTGAMYAAPYFDGNDDFENYALAKREWVRTLLDTTAPGSTTFAQQATDKSKTGTAPSVKSYMGTTDKWEIETTDPTDTKLDSTTHKTVKVVVNYKAALDAAKGTGALHDALVAASVDTSALTSGNIVDLQNAAITATNGAVTGAQLSAILRAYIDVAYQKTDGTKFYEKRSDVFNSSYAAWDVDLLTAIMRCVVTSKDAFDDATKALPNSQIYGLTAREATTQRRVNLYALGGELYGVRGMGSRYEYIYFDSNGTLHDARQDAESYDLMARMGDMSKEGLINTNNNGSSGKNSYANGTNPLAFMGYDYVQTQTKAALDGSAPEGYDFAPILTPVSKWDVDGKADNGHEKIMRFTESWRSVKNTGFAVPKAAVANNPNKLAATLALIDYLFTPDGQLLMTYGEASTKATSPDGWWYGASPEGDITQYADEYMPATNYSPAQYKIKDEYKTKYFVYKGKVYEGFAYKGGVVPKITDDNMKFYLGDEVNGEKQHEGNIVVSAVGSYTDYARKIIGTTLPIGMKNQGFEYQASAACGIDGANNLSVAELNGTIEHVKLTVTEDDNLWYLISPTALPMSAQDRTDWNGGEQSKISNPYFYNNSNKTQILNAYLDLVFFGFDTTKDICGIAAEGKLMTSGEAYVNWINGKGMTKRVKILSDNWQLLDAYYGITK